jgi:hypothetical protein
MTPFHAVPEGYEAHFEDSERIVIASFALEVANLLRAEAHVAEPNEADPLAALFAEAQVGAEITDPAVQRLLPDAVMTQTDLVDAEVAQEFRRLTQNDLALGKISGLTRLSKLLTADQRNTDHGLVIVPSGAAREVAAALTDIRLVLAQRLGVLSDGDVERMHRALFAGRKFGNEQRNYWASVFVLVGLAQESLVDAMLDAHRRRQ